LLLGTHFLRTGGELGTRQTRSSCLRAVPLERAGCVGRLTCSTALPRQSGWSAEARALSVSHRSNSSVLPPRSLWICRSLASCFATSWPVGQRPLSMSAKRLRSSSIEVPVTSSTGDGSVADSS